MRKVSTGVAQLVAVIVIGGLIVGVCVAALVPGVRDLASANESSGNVADALSPLSQRTVVYANDGETEIGLLGLEDRQYAPLEDVPQVVIDAVIAIEDQTFWDNPGYDLRSVLRALDENIQTGEISQGGSTITQQLAKLRLLGPERNLDRKVRELLLAFRINAEFSKEQILEQYLNTVYFGQGSYGIKSAAERFFTITDPATGAERPKRLSELDLADAALLAGNIQNPEGANPFIFPDRALTRRADVLNLMSELGYITPEEHWIAGGTPLPTSVPPAELRPDNHFVEAVQRELLEDERLGDTPAERENAVLRGGLRVTSTLDLTAQLNAQAAINTVLPEDPVFTGALVAMDPQTGAVKAVVGGEGFDESQYNIATQPPGRQPGSVYKVVTFVAALDMGYSPNDTIAGFAPCQIIGYGEDGLGRGPAKNSEGGGGSTATLRRQMAGSVNCAFLRLTEEIGVAPVADMANRLGIPDIEGLRTLPRTDNATSITLGAIEASPLEIATMGSTVAAGGVRRDPIFYTKVTAPDGTVLIDNSTAEGEQVIAPEIAACTIDVLRDVVRSGTGTSANIGRDVAGKTGTTDDRADAWFLGMTPGLVAAVWRGAPNAQIPGAGYGGQFPAQVWQNFMAAELEGSPELEFGEAGPVCDRPGDFIESDDTGGTVRWGDGNIEIVEEPDGDPNAEQPDPAPAPPPPTAPTLPVPPPTTPQNPGSGR